MVSMHTRLIDDLLQLEKRGVQHLSPRRLFSHAKNSRSPRALQNSKTRLYDGTRILLYRPNIVCGIRTVGESIEGWLWEIGENKY